MIGRICRIAPGGRPPARAAGALVLSEDGRLDGAQRRAGVEAEILAEVTPGGCVRGERLGLPVVPVQREHAHGPGGLAQRVRGGELGELPEHGTVFATVEPHAEQPFGDDQALLTEPGHLGGLGVVEQPAERVLAAPQRERLFARVGRGVEVAGGPRLRQLFGPGAEVAQVELVGHQFVARATSHQETSRRGGDTGLEGPAQPRDPALQGRRGRRRRLTGPEPVREPLGGHRPVGEQEQAQQGGRSPRADVEGAAGIVPGRDRTQDAEPHDRTVAVAPSVSDG